MPPLSERSAWPFWSAGAGAGLGEGLGGSWACAAAGAVVRAARDTAVTIAGRLMGASPYNGRLRSPSGKRPGARREQPRGEHGRADHQRTDHDGNLPAPVGLHGVGHRVVESMHADDGPQGAGPLVDQAEDHAQNDQRGQDQQLVEPLEAVVHEPEDHAVDQRGGGDAEAGAQGRVEEPAEEDLLGQGGEDHHHTARDDQPEGALIGAEALGDLLLGVGPYERAVEQREEVEGHQAERRPAHGRPEGRAPQAEMPRARARDQRGEEHRGGHERDVLNAGGEHREARRLLLPRLDSERSGGDARQQQRGQQRDDERGEAEAPGPARRLVGLLHPAQIRRARSPSERMAPPPSLSSSTPSIPVARAPSTSLSTESPTCSACSGLAPASSRPSRKGAGSGLAAPASAEEITPSTSPSRPASSSTLGSEQSQLLTTTSLRPFARSSHSAGAASGKARKRSAASMGSSRSATPSCSSSTRAQRDRSSASEMLSRPSRWCSR